MVRAQDCIRNLLMKIKSLAVQASAINLGQVDYNMFAFFALPLGETSLDTLAEEIDEGSKNCKMN